MRTNILGVTFDNDTVEEAAEKAVASLGGNKPFVIVTPNPEIVKKAMKDDTYQKLLNSADIVTPDGIGIVYASKIIKGNITQRAAGYDIICAIFQRLSKQKGSVYLFGGKPGVAELAKEKLKQAYPDLHVCGTHHGYFDEKDEPGIVAEIREKQPDFLLVCLGAPKQEFWIEKHKDALGAKILIGAGGSLDALAGTVKRAPEFFQKAGLEWFYRLMKEPSRLGRMMVLPVFLLDVLRKGR